ncbi:MAG TPA: hypothetical protein PLD10_04540 [Rhodopila sp.]|nr:hypothetical protein [Rhodopila sp.]
MAKIPQDQPPGSRRRGMIGLVLVAALILAMAFMVQKLRQASALQDCVASGRTNCAPIETGR